MNKKERVPKGIFNTLKGSKKTSKPENNIQETRKQYTESGIQKTGKIENNTIDSGKKVTYYLNKTLIKRLKILSVKKERKLSSLVTEALENLLRKYE